MSHCCHQWHLIALLLLMAQINNYRLYFIWCSNDCLQVRSQPIRLGFRGIQGRQGKAQAWEYRLLNLLWQRYISLDKIVMFFFHVMISSMINTSVFVITNHVALLTCIKLRVSRFIISWSWWWERNEIFGLHYLQNHEGIGHWLGSSTNGECMSTMVPSSSDSLAWTLGL